MSRYRARMDIDDLAVRRSDWRSVIRRFQPRKSASHVMSDFAALIRRTICNPASVICPEEAGSDVLPSDFGPGLTCYRGFQ